MLIFPDQFPEKQVQDLNGNEEFYTQVNKQNSKIRLSTLKEYYL